MPANPSPAPLSSETLDALRALAKRGRALAGKHVAAALAVGACVGLGDDSAHAEKVLEGRRDAEWAFLDETQSAVAALLDEVERLGGEYVRGLHEGRAKAIDEAADGEIEWQLATALDEVERGRAKFPAEIVCPMCSQTSVHLVGRTES